MLLRVHSSWCTYYFAQVQNFSFTLYFTSSTYLMYFSQHCIRMKQGCLEHVLCRVRRYLCHHVRVFCSMHGQWDCGLDSHVWRCAVLRTKRELSYKERTSFHNSVSTQVRVLSKARTATNTDARAKSASHRALHALDWFSRR